MEFVGVKNLPDEKKGNLFVLFSKTQPDVFFKAKQKLTILSKSGQKQVASFQCEPNGELLFELVSHSASNLPGTKTCKTLGTASLSLREFLVPVSKLAVEKWLDLMPSSGNGSSKPIGLRVAVSFTVPAIAPHMLHMVRSRPFSKGSCFQLPLAGRVQAGKGCTRVIDETQAEVIRLQMRYTDIQISYRQATLTLPSTYFCVLLCICIPLSACLSFSLFCVCVYTSMYITVTIAVM